MNGSRKRESHLAEMAHHRHYIAPTGLARFPFQSGAAIRGLLRMWRFAALFAERRLASSSPSRSTEPKVRGSNPDGRASKAPHTWGFRRFVMNAPRGLGVPGVSAPGHDRDWWLATLARSRCLLWGRNRSRSGGHQRAQLRARQLRRGPRLRRGRSPPLDRPPRGHRLIRASPLRRGGQLRRARVSAAADECEAIGDEHHGAVDAVVGSHTVVQCVDDPLGLVLRVQDAAAEQHVVDQ
jgi:hypothetical protein